MDIEQYIIQYKGKTFSNSEDALDYWRKALKQNTEQVIKAMLVEEMEKLENKKEGVLYYKKLSDGHRTAPELYGLGYNDCCALQKANEKKLKEQLKI